MTLTSKTRHVVETCVILYSPGPLSPAVFGMVRYSEPLSFGARYPSTLGIILYNFSLCSLTQQQSLNAYSQVAGTLLIFLFSLIQVLPNPSRLRVNTTCCTAYVLLVHKMNRLSSKGQLVTTNYYI